MLARLVCLFRNHQWMMEKLVDRKSTSVSTFMICIRCGKWRVRESDIVDGSYKSKQSKLVLDDLDD